MHNYNIKNIYRNTLRALMIDNKMPVPQEWENESKMSIFDKAYFGIIPKINGH